MKAAHRAIAIRFEVEFWHSGRRIKFIGIDFCMKQ
jgi:hypothetical protein